MTTAEKISALFGDDGRVWVGDHGEDFCDVCEVYPSGGVSW